MISKLNRASTVARRKVTSGFLVKSTRQWLLVTGLIAGSMTANASTLIGEWTGTGQNVPDDGTTLVVDLYFLTQTPDGSAFDLTGTVDVTCLHSSDPKCGSDGILSLTGSLLANDTVTFTASSGAMFNGSLVNPNLLTGVATNPSTEFEADFTLLRVPEPATLSLLGLGLAGIGFMRKRKSN